MRHRERMRHLATDARRKFSRFKKDDPNAVRDLKMEEGLMATLVKEWMAFVNLAKGVNELNAETKLLHSASQAGKGIVCSAKDIKEFCGLVEKYSVAFDESVLNNLGIETGTGFFLSALINQSPDEHFVIPKAISFANYLCYRNTKNVIIEGQFNSALGAEMKQGTIYVMWGPGESLGLDMEGGVIIAAGDYPGSLGGEMRGGMIVVRGNVTLNPYDNFLQNMQGGEVHIYGEIIENGGTLDSELIEGGKVYVRGKLIVDK